MPNQAHRNTFSPWAYVRCTVTGRHKWVLSLARPGFLTCTACGARKRD